MKIWGIRNRKNILIFIMSLVMVFMTSGMKVYAERDEVDSVVYIAENQVEISSICSRANSVVGESILVYTGNDGLLSFSNKKYKELTVDDRREFMEEALLSTKESGLGSQIKNKTYNFIAKQDTTTSAAVKYLRSDASADFAEAASWFKPFGSAFGVAFGVLSLFIFMFIGLSILIDVSYMALPFVRWALQKDENKIPKFVSTDAYSSVRESENSIKGNGYKGYMSLYFRRRVPAIIIMSVALGYLISGQIYDIVVYLMDSFSWIFK